MLYWGLFVSLLSFCQDLNNQSLLPKATNTLKEGRKSKSEVAKCLLMILSLMGLFLLFHVLFRVLRKLGWPSENHKGSSMQNLPFLGAWNIFNDLFLKDLLSLEGIWVFLGPGIYIKRAERMHKFSYGLHFVQSGYNPFTRHQGIGSSVPIGLSCSDRWRACSDTRQSEATTSSDQCWVGKQQW